MLEMRSVLNTYSCKIAHLQIAARSERRPEAVCNILR